MKNYSSHKRKVFILLILLVCLPVFFITVFYLSNMTSRDSDFCPKGDDGYCVAEKRYLTDQEKCDIAVKEVIKERERYVSRYYYTLNEAGKQIRSERLIKQYDYASMEEFYAMNSDCCRFVEEFWHPDRPPYTIPCEAKASGLLNTFITITYIFAYDEYNSNKPIEHIATFALSNCGKLWTRNELLDFYHPELGRAANF
jgi:hypothetical protein